MTNTGEFKNLAQEEFKDIKETLVSVRIYEKVFSQVILDMIAEAMMKKGKLKVGEIASKKTLIHFAKDGMLYFSQEFIADLACKMEMIQELNVIFKPLTIFTIRYIMIYFMYKVIMGGYPTQYMVMKKMGYIYIANSVVYPVVKMASDEIYN